MDLSQASHVANSVDWTQILTITLIVVTNLGTVIGLYLHTDRKIDENRETTNLMIEESRKESNEILKSIRDDIKEFHVAMRDFHGRMCAIEERGKK